MNERETTCCFTGHRPASLPWGSREEDRRCQYFKQELAASLEGIYDSGYTHFLCGMALGCDTWFAEAVLALRELHPEVTLEAVIPCGSQPDKWNVAQRKRYNRLLDASNKVTVLQIAYTPDCMMRRNRYMVDHASLLLAAFSGRPGGTMNTIVYAQRQGLTLITIDLGEEGNAERERIFNRR